MKKIFTLLLVLFSTIILRAQVCTITGFDVCTPGPAVPPSDFRNPVQITGTGTALTVGSKYKFDFALPTLNLDAVVSIDAIVNATMAGALNPSIDDDASANETNTAGTQIALFAPRIAPDQTLSCTNRRGYVEFTVQFYTHYTGNALPTTAAVAVANLNFLHFDMDGSPIGNDGWFKEIGYVKVNGASPINFASGATELTNGGNISGWLLTFGSTTERNSVSRCAEVIEKSVYSAPQTAVSFRMGYDYKAPTINCAASSFSATRQYGSKFGCYNLPSGGPLPVTLTNLAANYNDGKTNITWVTQQEISIYSYEVQRSFDGVNFEYAGTIKANNLSSAQQYKFTDNVASFSAKYIYYRVKVIEQTSIAKITNVVSVKLANWKANEMIISPNPSSTNAQIKINTAKAAKGDISVFDATGKLVLKQQASLLAGNNSIVLNDITTLSGGYYTVRLVANEETFTSKLLIWK
jgi:Secretion system C-terminal sorting domain